MLLRKTCEDHNKIIVGEVELVGVKGEK